MTAAEVVILYSTSLRTWEVWQQGRPVAHGSLAACLDAYPAAPEPTDRQHRIAAGITTAWGPFGTKTGPVHADRTDATDLSWCGVKRQFRHGTHDVEAIDCRTCLRQIKKGQPLAWGAR